MHSLHIQTPSEMHQGGAIRKLENLGGEIREISFHRDSEAIVSGVME